MKLKVHTLAVVALSAAISLVAAPATANTIAELPLAINETIRDNAEAHATNDYAGDNNTTCGIFPRDPSDTPTFFGVGNGTTERKANAIHQHATDITEGDIVCSSLQSASNFQVNVSLTYQYRYFGVFVDGPTIVCPAVTANGAAGVRAAAMAIPGQCDSQVIYESDDAAVANPVHRTKFTVTAPGVNIVGYTLPWEQKPRAEMSCCV